jgi:hypothetical protein
MPVSCTVTGAVEYSRAAAQTCGSLRLTNVGQPAPSRYAALDRCQVGMLRLFKRNNIFVAYDQSLVDLCVCGLRWAKQWALDSARYPQLQYPIACDNQVRRCMRRLKDPLAD